MILRFFLHFALRFRPMTLTLLPQLCRLRREARGRLVEVPTRYRRISRIFRSALFHSGKEGGISQADLGIRGGRFQHPSSGHTNALLDVHNTCDIAIDIANSSIENIKIAEKHARFCLMRLGTEEIGMLVFLIRLGTEEFAGTRGSAKELSVGREEKEMSITTKLEDREGGLRKVIGKVGKGRTHRRSAEEWWELQAGELREMGFRI